MFAAGVLFLFEDVAKYMLLLYNGERSWFEIYTVLISRQSGSDPMEINQLEWILKSAKHVVLFYDQYQSVKLSDISHNEHQNSRNIYTDNLRKHKIETQMSCDARETLRNNIEG